MNADQIQQVKQIDGIHDRKQNLAAFWIL